MAGPGADPSALPIVPCPDCGRNVVTYVARHGENAGECFCTNATITKIVSLVRDRCRCCQNCGLTKCITLAGFDKRSTDGQADINGCSAS